MAYIPRSSFSGGGVPSAIPLQVKKKRSIKIVSLSASVLFFLSVASAAGVYFYKDFVDRELDVAKSGLNDISSIDDPKERIEEIRNYNSKLVTAKNLLDNHIAPSRIFALIEDITKETVQFRSFAFVYDPGFDAELELIGNTKEFTSVALQKMQMYKDGPFSEFKVHDINTLSGGEEENAEEDVIVPQGVAFSITGIFNKDAVEYTGVESASSSIRTVTRTVAAPATTTATTSMGNRNEVSSSTQTNI